MEWSQTISDIGSKGVRMDYATGQDAWATVRAGIGKSIRDVRSGQLGR
jgi:hypothetical protein